MGLDTTHGAWHGAYSAFMRWRIAIAKAAQFPPLELMEGYWTKGSPYDPAFMLKSRATQFLGDPEAEEAYERYARLLPISWHPFRHDPLTVLLTHSDCEGEIGPEDCDRIATRLEGLLPALDGDGGGHLGDIKEATQRFIDGCRAAAEADEPLEFH